MAINNGIKSRPADYERAIENGYSEDLAPITADKREWGLMNYFTLWMGSVHNVPNYVAVGGFLYLGLSPLQVMLALILSSFGVMAILVLNGGYGFDYGIPSTLALRSTYGSRGAKLPGFLRGVIAAIMWYGLQTFAGSQALEILLSRLIPGFMDIGGNFSFFGISASGLISFTIFWVINLMIGLGGGETISKFTAILNPLIYIIFGGMMIWAIRVAGGLSAILSFNSGATLENSALFIMLMIISSVLSVWAAPGVSSSDFSRNGKDYKSMALGQGLGLFVAYLLFAFSSVCILIGATIYSGEAQWNILEIIEGWNSTAAVAISLLVLLMTTVSTNATGNIIPAGYQLATMFPKLDFRSGVLMASVVSFMIMPWKLMENQDSIYMFLDVIGSLMGPIVGTMIAHYYFVIKRDISLTRLYAKDVSLYKPDINYAAYISTIVGAAVPLLFKFIPAIEMLSQVSFILSFAVAFVVYLVASRTMLRNYTHRTEDEMPEYYRDKKED